jgi:hypothetical protein
LNLGWRAVAPIGDNLLEFVGGHAGMGRHDQFRHVVLARRCEGFHVPFQHRLERLRFLPFRVQRRQYLHPIEGESQLDVNRMLDPQGPVVVEGRDALGRRHEIRAALPTDSGNEIGDCPLGYPFVPRW